MLAFDYAPTIAPDLLWPVAALSRPVMDFGPVNDLLFKQQVETRRIPTTSQAKEIIAVDVPRPGLTTVACHEDTPALTSVSDAWLDETLAIIHRDLVTKPELKESTQALAVYMVSAPFERRPQILVDDDGTPAFATSTDSFYINLTVDSPAHLTWFAVENGVEAFAEEVPFDGAHLPEALEKLLLGRL